MKYNKPSIFYIFLCLPLMLCASNNELGLEPQGVWKKIVIKGIKTPTCDQQYDYVIKLISGEIDETKEDVQNAERLCASNDAIDSLVEVICCKSFRERVTCIYGFQESHLISFFCMLWKDVSPSCGEGDPAFDVSIHRLKCMLCKKLRTKAPFAFAARYLPICFIAFGIGLACWWFSLNPLSLSSWNKRLFAPLSSWQAGQTGVVRNVIDTLYGYAQKTESYGTLLASGGAPYLCNRWALGAGIMGGLFGSYLVRRPTKRFFELIDAQVFALPSFFLP